MALGSFPHLLHGEIGLLVGWLTWVSKPVVEALHRPLGMMLAQTLVFVPIPVRMNGLPLQDGGAPCSQPAAKWLVDFLEQ